MTSALESRQSHAVSHAVLSTDGIGVVEFARRHRQTIRHHLDHAGAVLLRGCEPGDPVGLEGVVTTFAARLSAENGEHISTAMSARVYRPVVYAPEQKLLWHNENSFDEDWPSILCFYCVRPADQGGQTVLADSRVMLGRLDPSLVDEFDSKKVAYVRTMGLGIGRDWRQVFRTEDRRETEAACRANHFEYTWIEADVLQTRCVREAVVTHPRTGRLSWFNQAQHWHQSCLDAETREELQELFGADAMPRHCTFGNGDEIPADAMTHILDTYQALEWPVDWRAHELLLVDNVALAHGRNPYHGERELLVAMGMGDV